MEAPEETARRFLKLVRSSAPSASDADRAWGAVSSGEVIIDGRSVSAPLDHAELRRTILPAASAAAGVAGESGRHRIIIGVAGPPGVGKSILAVQLAVTTDALLPEGQRAAHLPLDGFHYTNNYLRSRPANGSGTLYDYKGRPETFDAEGFAEALARVRTAENVSLPLYDRKTHDPAQGALRLDVSHRVIFCEGNFLYLDTPRWRAVARLLDVRLFVEAPESLLKRNLSERFGRGGRSRAEIDEQWRRVDAPNVADIGPGIKAAHLVLVKDAENTLRTIRV